MQADDLDRKWRNLTGELTRSMQDWRVAHPRATLREIEAALDAWLVRVRVQMLQDTASTSPLCAVRAAQAAGMAVPCSACGQALADQGLQTRRLTTQGEQVLQLERSYAVCPGCGTGLFPPGPGIGPAAGQSDP